MCGIASGISFIALRDLDATTFRSRLVTPPTWPAFSKGSYEWSFMLHWIATGLSLVVSFLLLCLMRNSYDTVKRDSKRTRYSSV